ncbi:HEAT repeat domain-containing protein [Methanocella arvoryzae]|nr:HEAT repeat domain-containing protein [Methanocella arvoryzae]
MSGFFQKILGTDTAGTVKKIQYYGNAKTQEGIPKLIQYMSDESVEIRRAASRALEHHWMTGRNDAIAVLTRALGDADMEVRKNSSLALGEFLSKAAVSAEEPRAARQALIRLLQGEKEAEVIKSTILGLGYLQDGSLITPMADALRAKDKKIISQAIDTIGNLPPTEVRLEMKKALRSII